MQVQLEPEQLERALKPYGASGASFLAQHPKLAEQAKLACRTGTIAEGVELR